MGAVENLAPDRGHGGGRPNLQAGRRTGSKNKQRAGAGGPLELLIFQKPWRPKTQAEAKARHQLLRAQLLEACLAPYCWDQKKGKPCQVGKAKALRWAAKALGWDPRTVRQALAVLVERGRAEEGPWNLELGDEAWEWRRGTPLAKIPRHIYANGRLTPRQQFVAGRLKARWDHPSGPRKLTARNLAEDLRLDIANVKRDLRNLQELGFVETRREKCEGAGCRNRYFLVSHTPETAEHAPPKLAKHTPPPCRTYPAAPAEHTPPHRELRRDVQRVIHKDPPQKDEMATKVSAPEMKGARKLKELAESDPTPEVIERVLAFHGIHLGPRWADRRKALARQVADKLLARAHSTGRLLAFLASAKSEAKTNSGGYMATALSRWVEGDKREVRRMETATPLSSHHGQLVQGSAHLPAEVAARW